MQYLSFPNDGSSLSGLLILSLEEGFDQPVFFYLFINLHFFCRSCSLHTWPLATIGFLTLFHGLFIFLFFFP
jgi:hypothetical protein